MTTGKNPVQHQGTFRNAEQVIQVVIIIFSTKVETLFIKQGLTKDLTDNTSPNYNNYQPSPIGSIPGQDLSTTLIELANIQSRSLEIMAANQRSQQEAFNKLTKASKDKANDAMFVSIRNYDGRNRQVFKDWIDEINQACRVSGHNFRTEIIKKLTGAVHQVVMTSNNCSDDELLTKLRSCFSDAPTMNQVHGRNWGT